MTLPAPLPALPLFVKLAGRPVILLGEGEAAEAKRRLLLRAGAEPVGERADARIAIVAIEDAGKALAAVERLRARSVLVNAVDRPELCDFTLPAIVDRTPVLVAIGTAGVSAGLAAALRQRLEAMLPATLGRLAEALHAARPMLRARFPDGGARRRAIGAALAPGGALDPLGAPVAVADWLAAAGDVAGRVAALQVTGDPDALTLRDARLLALADRIHHAPDVPAAILDRARADAVRIARAVPDVPEPGLTLWVEMRR